MRRDKLAGYGVTAASARPLHNAHTLFLLASMATSGERRRRAMDSLASTVTSGEQRRRAMDSPASTGTGGEQRHEGCA
jgi:hypothetical protein